MNRKMKNKVKRFVSQYKIDTVSYFSLKKAAEEMGYSVIEFNRISNDKNVEIIINSLKLGDIVLRSKGFTYADEDYRLIFINESLSENEKILILSHEIGHIYCSHLDAGSIIGKDVRDEYEANEFSHYLLNQSVWQKVRRILFKHKRAAVAVAVILALGAAAGVSVAVYTKEQSYYGDYYITETGNKYHKKDCIFVKNKTNIRRLTKDEFDSGKYEPCEMCLPQYDEKKYTKGNEYEKKSMLFNFMYCKFAVAKFMLMGYHETGR